MLNIPIYSEKKLLLAFEYGMMMSTVAIEQKVTLSREIMERAEEIVKKEFRKKTCSKLAIETLPNILAMFEPEEKK